MSELGEALTQPTVGSPTVESLSPKKEGQSLKKKWVIYIRVCLALLVLLVGGTGAYLLLSREKEDTSEGLEQQESDPYEGWETYENEKYGFSFKYPSDWELNEDTTNNICTSGYACGAVTVTKDNYVWELSVDPIYTGGSWGYFLDEFDYIGISSSSESTVKPADYECSVVTRYLNQVDPEVYEVIDPDVTPFKFSENAWGWSVVWRNADQSTDLSGIGLDPGYPGFGPGDATDDIAGSYFSIVYKYNSQNEDYSDLPVEGDQNLDKMLTVMDKITNSFELEEEGA